MKKLTRAVARKVLAVVDAGLSSGLGQPEPGRMCVEAAVCYALRLPHGDDPGCVAASVRSLKIALNDKGWSSNEERAKGLRRLAIVQLGTMGAIKDDEFSNRLATMVIRTVVPRALRSAASVAVGDHPAKLEAAAKECEMDPTRANAAANAAYAAYAAYAAANAANAAYVAANAAYVAAARAMARDGQYARFAEDVVQLLVEMGAPGAKWLDLTEAPVFP